MKYTVIFFAFLFALVVSSCEKDDPAPINEEELITTVRLVCTPVSGGDVVTLAFEDLDGDGGDAPVITGGALKANTNYTAEVTFLNESVTPADNITEEVLEEGTEHQVFLAFAGIDMSYGYLDSDADGNPIGLEMSLSAGGAGSGQLVLVLRHEPVKDNPGVASGDITNAGGETDVEVVFPVEIVE
jgi:hypothetical protein